jgi:hypothetical protein
MISATMQLLQSRVRGINRRARRAGVPGRITRDDLQQILMNTDVACPQCDTPFGFGFPYRWTYCFAVSLQRGGDNTVQNASILCRRCEMQRATAMGVRSLRASRQRHVVGLHGHAVRLDSGTINAGRAVLAARPASLAWSAESVTTRLPACVRTPAHEITLLADSSLVEETI